ncbi:hypothetical protein DJ030_17755 [bacterium endosymbiont of Escarpia laminata]|nr:MAG: hypothetical protein DJ030_17755 [bacterium endosymbiont of Escarpia laminata]
MFGSVMLEVAIGLAFIYVLLSLLCSSLNEMIAGFFNLRSKNLLIALNQLLTNEAKPAEDSAAATLISKVTSHPFISALKQPPVRFFGKHRDEKVPNYIPPHTFAVTLLDAIGARSRDGKMKTVTSIRSLINKEESEHLKRSLLPLLDNAGDDLEKIQSNIEAWFDTSMDRASGWYRRQSQMIILLVASVVVTSMNIDTIHIAHVLWHDSGVRTALVAQAEQLAKSDKDALTKDQNYKEVVKKIEGLSLPLGWDSESVTKFWQNREDVKGDKENRLWAVLVKITGLLITILSISMGAPFWFDLLNKLVDLRSVGKRPSRVAGSPGREGNAQKPPVVE